MAIDADADAAAGETAVCRVLRAAYGPAASDPRGPAFVSSGMQHCELERLRELAADAGPGAVALEVGMANGTSALAMLAALAPAGGRLVSVDPYQHAPAYGGAGVEALRRAGLGPGHELIERPDYLALPGLLAEGRRFSLVLVDGWHSLDHTMLDLFYADLLLDVGGVVAVHDSWSPPVHDCCRWLSRHKPYRFVSPPPVRHAGIGVRVLRRLGGTRPGRSGWGTLAAYRKLADRRADQWPHETLFDRPGAIRTEA